MNSRFVYNNYQRQILRLFKASSRRKHKSMRRCIGEEMVSSHEENRPMPVVLQTSRTDSATAKDLKGIILKMIEFESNNRVKMAVVESSLAGKYIC